MAGYQFGHSQWFGQKGATKRRDFKGHHGTQRDKGWSVSDVLAEAMRERGHCGHVQNPELPNIVYGSLDAVQRAAKAYADSLLVAVKIRGQEFHRRARSDSPCMVGGVISMPRSRIQDWPEFRKNAIEQLEKRYGDRLKLVLEHLNDEAHPHFHYYLVPEIGEDFGVVHEGYAASRKARNEPGNNVSKAYKTAMRGWQDWLHETIAKPFDMARVGPKRQRDDYQTAKERSRAAALDQREADLVMRESKLFTEDANVKKMLSDIQRREGLIVVKQAAMAAGAASVSKKQTQTQKELDRLFAENSKTVDVLRAMFDTLDASHKYQVSLISPDLVEKLGVADDPELKAMGDLGLG